MSNIEINSKDKDIHSAKVNKPLDKEESNFPKIQQVKVICSTQSCEKRKLKKMSEISQEVLDLLSPTFGPGNSSCKPKKYLNHPLPFM